jgi:excinuclease ABC subunit C
VVDGGRGQLNVLTTILEELGISGIDAVSLAKSRVERDMAEREVVRSDERVFLPGRRNPVVLRQNGAPLLLLARIRDEAHRFAITYHQKLRGKGSIQSSLEAIPGIGEKRKRELLRHFGSLRALREADREQLAAVPTISSTLADAIWKSIHGEETD